MENKIRYAVAAALLGLFVQVQPAAAASKFQRMVDHVVINTDLKLLNTIEAPVYFDWVNGDSLAGVSTILANYQDRLTFSYDPLKRVKAEASPVQHNLMLSLNFEDQIKKYLTFPADWKINALHASFYVGRDFSLGIWRAGMKASYRLTGQNIKDAPFSTGEAK